MATLITSPDGVYSRFVADSDVTEWVMVGWHVSPFLTAPFPFNPIAHIADITAALAGITGAATTPSTTVTNNGDGTVTLTNASPSAITVNGDGTVTLT